MKNLLRLEWNKLKLSVIVTTLVGILASIVLCSTVYKSYSLESQLEVWEVGFAIFNFVAPLVVVIPTCWLMYFERKNRFITYTLPRVSQRQYLLSKWIVISGSAFCMMFCISFAGVLMALYGIKPIEITYGWISPITGEAAPRLLHTHVAGELFTENAIVYGLLISLWKGLISVVYVTMGFIFSLYSQNLFIILTGPFLYTILENFLLSILKLEHWRLVVAFEPTIIPLDALRATSFVVGPLLAFVMMGMYIAYMQYKGKQTIYRM